LKKLKVLLLGNGINRIDNDYSWEHLMQDLLKKVDMTNSISHKDKPFPLLYEEIYLRWFPNEKLSKERTQAKAKSEADAKGTEYFAPKRKQSEEYILKSMISSLMENIRSNTLHYKALHINVDEIMTTNYDYNLETKAPGGRSSCKPIPPVKGSKYSVMRRYKVANKVLWHIHGEAKAPGSILLGYEQYAGYLQYVRNYMIEGYSYSESPSDKENEESRRIFLNPLMQRLQSGDSTIHSWIDHFFHNDIYILGLNMDFTEMHLWWLIDFRARLKHDKRMSINNKITFLYPGHETSWIKPRIDLLCACGVSCIALPVENNNWKGMYSLALDYIDRRSPSDDGMNDGMAV
jgi:hypothetical protein